jgi:integrase
MLYKDPEKARAAKRRSARSRRSSRPIREAELLKAAKLPKMRLRDLRHSSASLLLSQGIPARVVMERLGHSNIALTLGTYSHVIPQLHQEAADAIDLVLGLP